MGEDKGWERFVPLRVTEKRPARHDSGLEHTRREVARFEGMSAGHYKCWTDDIDPLNGRNY